MTRLPARAELTLVDPFSCTEMEGTLQDRKQGRRRWVSKARTLTQRKDVTTCEETFKRHENQRSTMGGNGRLTSANLQSARNR